MANGRDRPAIVKLPPMVFHPGINAENSMLTAAPPMKVWMPNQPHATPARRRAGILAPKTPKDARARIGKGMPYFVPGWALRSMGIRTMRLPRVMVKSACFQFIPRAMSPPASMYVGMQWAIPIHRAA